MMTRDIKKKRMQKYISRKSKLRGGMTGMIKPYKSEGVAILAPPSYIFIELDWKTMLRLRK
ncbi:hypothetical protein ACFQDF_25585 [Ectobacillus funiculus]